MFVFLFVYWASYLILDPGHGTTFLNALPDLDLNIFNLFVQNLNSFCDQL